MVQKFKQIMKDVMSKQKELDIKTQMMESQLEDLKLEEIQQQAVATNRARKA